MEATRAALDKEHQLQVLQMEAINALWKKVRIYIHIMQVHYLVDKICYTLYFYTEHLTKTCVN